MSKKFLLASKQGMSNMALIKAICAGDQLAVQKLLESGADRNCVDSNNRNAIHHAAIKGDATIMFLVLHYKAELHNSPNIEAVDAYAKQPVQYANTHDKLLVNRLLTKQRGLNKRLKQAARSGNIGLLEKLCKEGAYLNVKGADGRRAIDVARECGRKEVVNWFYKMGIGYEVKAASSWWQGLLFRKMV